MQKVKLYVMISGDYCAFHEMSFNVCYDVTNDIELDSYSLEELENWDRDKHDYSDVELVDGIKDGDKYYYSL